MGFFGKAKNFFGGHGTKVEITRIERQPVEAACFPVTDSVFKGNIRVTAEKESLVLKHVMSLVLLVESGDPEKPDHEIELSEDIHDESTEIIGGDVSWPYTLEAGKSVEDGFVLSDVDIAKELEKLGLDDPLDAVNNTQVKLMARVIADVKGSPFDPHHEAEVTLTVPNEGADDEDVSLPQEDQVLVPMENSPGVYVEMTAHGSREGQVLVKYDDGSESWLSAPLSIEVVPTIQDIQQGTKVYGKHGPYFTPGSVVTVDKGDMVNRPKACINFEDGSQEWMPVEKLRIL